MGKIIQFGLLGIGVLLLFFIFTSFLGFYTTIRPKRLISSATPADYELEYQKIELTSSDGIKLAGWFIPSSKADARSAIIGLHGYPADKGNILPGLIPLAKNYHLLLFDFRYHGSSQGAYTTVGAKEVNDLLAAIKYLESRQINTIGIWGFSMGGAVALMSLPHSSSIKAVVADSSYSRLENMAPQLFLVPGATRVLAELTRWWGKLLLRLDIRDVSPAQAITQSRLPILIIHSKTDNVIPFTNALELQSALSTNPQAEFWFPPEPSHGAINHEYQNQISDFFSRSLK